MKKLLLILLAVSLLLVISCQSSQPSQSSQTESTQTENLQGKPWINSNIFGNWPSNQPALEDGFELSLNYNLYMKALSENKYIDDFYTQSGEFQEKRIKELIADYVDPPRFFPLTGPVQVHHTHYKCTIYYEQTIRVGWPIPYTIKKLDGSEVIYIDKDHLHAVGTPHENQDVQAAME